MDSQRPSKVWTLLADQIRASVDTDPPAWVTRCGSVPPSSVIADVQVWRAAMQVSPEDRRRGEVADVDATLVEVEAERFGSAVAEGEGCEAFGGVGEPVQLGEPGCSVGVGDVAEDAAGADLAIAAAGTGKSTAMQTLAAAFRTACGPPSTSPRLPATAASWATGSVPCAASSSRWARRVGHAGSSVRPGTICSAAIYIALPCRRCGRCGGCVANEARAHHGSSTSGESDAVDRGAVGSPQHRRFGDAVVRSGQRHRQVPKHVADQQIDQPRTLRGLEFDGSHLSLCLGSDVPDLPGRAVFLHHRQDPASCILDPLGVHRRSGDWVRVQCGRQPDHGGGHRTGPPGRRLSIPDQSAGQVGSGGQIVPPHRVADGARPIVSPPVSGRSLSSRGKRLLGQDISTFGIQVDYAKYARLHVDQIPVVDVGRMGQVVVV
jgi:hypothetical protein